MIQSDLLTGKTTEHLTVFNETKFLVHIDMLDSLNRMFKEASKEGIELALASSYRSYEAQRIIWNNKVMGLRPVLDSDSLPIDISKLTHTELMFKILRWSAIPGGSRHHWGTDFDVYDKFGTAENYELQLIPQEYEQGGPFYRAHLWLTENMERFGFMRPYQKDKGGIAPEPWHLSYRPLSEQFLKQFTYELFVQHLGQSDFLLKEEALLNAHEIYHRFIRLD